MKRTKKMLALVLALMMAFTTLVMPAMAADEDEGIMPLKPGAVCPYCDRLCDYVNIPGIVEYENGCSSKPWPHVHHCYFRDSFTCPTHGTFYGPAVESPCS